MTDTKVDTYGVYRLHVTGPPAALANGYLEATVEGHFSDEHDRANLVYKASEQVARHLGLDGYDDLPDELCPLEFEIHESHNEFVTPAFRQAFFVTVYDVCRNYGGPEEGGWWYDAGEPIQHVTCGSYAEARQVAATLSEGPYPQTGNRHKVHGGEDYSVRISLRPGEAYPAETPHYE